LFVITESPLRARVVYHQNLPIYLVEI